MAIDKTKSGEDGHPTLQGRNLPEPKTESCQPSILTLNPGDRVGNYEIVSKLGEGGMGIVYLAKDLQLKRPVAIKFILRDAPDKVFTKRFLRELEISAQFNHPNIVKVYRSDTFRGLPYLVMEYVEGRPLLQYIQEQRLELSDQLQILAKIAEALDYAHKHEVVHRDVKPSNILVRSDGEPVLMDFGIAKTLSKSDYALTRDGEVIGTLEYMSPEQAGGLRHEIGPLTDVYALGAVFYHMLVGHPPVTGETALQKMYQIAHDHPISPISLVPEIPEAVENICLRALEKNKSNRYPSAKALAKDIHLYLKGGITASRKFYERRRLLRQLRLAAAAGAGIIAIVGLIWLLSHTGHIPTAGRTLSGKAGESPTNAGLTVARYYQKGLEALKAQQNQEAGIYLEQAWEAMQHSKTPGKSPSVLQVGGKLAEFYLGERNYQKAYEIGKKILAVLQTPTAKWDKFEKNCAQRYFGQAAYHCGAFEEARSTFESLLHSYQEEENKGTLEPLDFPIYIGSLYYQGIIFFHREQWGQAQERLSKALQIIQWEQERLAKTPQLQNRHPEPYPFLNSLYAHYCACQLVDLSQPLSAQDDAVIAAYLQNLSKDAPGETNEIMFHNTIRARYFLKLAQQAQGGLRQQHAQKSLDILQNCARHNVYKAEFYYLRGNAYLLLKQYQEARQDFIKAVYLAPHDQTYLSSKLGLLSEYADLEDLQGHDAEFLRDLASAQKLPHLFEKEFARLRHYYLAQQEGCAKGIPFSQSKLQEFWQWLQQSSQIQEAAEVGVCSMVPASQVLQALQDKSRQQMSATARQSLQRLRDKVEMYEQKRQRQNLLVSLSRVPARGPLHELPEFAEENKIKLLKQVLTPSVSAPGSAHSVFLRFLAARVLVHMPWPENRLELWQTYMNSSDFTTKILLAKAFDEIDVVTALWDKHFLPAVSEKWAHGLVPVAGCEGFAIEEENEFLQALLAESLPFRDATACNLAETLLTKSAMRVKMTAASRFPVPPTSVQRALVTALRDGMDSPNPDIQAAAITILASYLNIPNPIKRTDWLSIILENFCQGTDIPADKRIPTYFCERLSNVSPAVQKAILQFWQGFSDVLGWNENWMWQVQASIRPLWHSPNLLVRTLAFRMSARLRDDEVYQEERRSNRQLSAMDRVSMIAGTVGNKGARENKLFFRLDSPEESCYVKALLLYSIARYTAALGKEKRKKIELTTLQQILPPKIMQFIRHEHPVMRFAALSCIPYLTNVPPQLVKTVHELKEKEREQNPYIHNFAMCVLLDIAHRQKSAEAEQLHQWVKKQEEPFGRKYRDAVAHYYATPLEILLGFGYEVPWNNWEPDQIWEYKAQIVESHLEKTPQQLPEFKAVLEKIADLLAATPADKNTQDYTYLLALCHKVSKDYDKAATVLARHMDKIGTQDLQLTEFWTHILLEQGKINEARQKLEEKLRAFQESGEDKKGLSAYASQLKRSLAHVYIAENKQPSEAIETLVREQYLLAPHWPGAWKLLDKYYDWRKDYHELAFLCEEWTGRWRNYGILYMSLAKAYKELRDYERCLFNLKQAFAYNFFPGNELRSWVKDWPRNGTLAKQLTKTYFFMRQYEECLESFKEAYAYGVVSAQDVETFMAGVPKDGAACLWLARAYAFMDIKQETLSYLRKARRGGAISTLKELKQYPEFQKPLREYRRLLRKIFAQTEEEDNS